ncbi:hypothetical protein [Crystallibacter crystallopoietes]|uniref:hypothetical protein n=1 Tax=Crystallibacter crystallopoietes TaxID=37928 RepID=UPI0012377A9E|nr:hypothetical protein [Arthrobacter crystallopoietes]
MKKPSGEPMPTRKELRTGMIQTVPAKKAEPAGSTPTAEPSAKSIGNSTAKNDPKPSHRRPWFAAAAAAAVACAILSWFLLAG